jgi:iron-sulfur cluster repair protein YtfE (RIC family)
MKATELLKHDHDAVKQLFAECESSESAEDKLDVFEEIREQLLIHARIEEEIFYPAVKKTNSGGAKSEIDEALREHQQVKTMLEKLDAMAAEADAEFAETLRTLSKNVQHHVQEEESEIFASARQLGEERLEELGERLRERKEQLMETGLDPKEPSAEQ